jgi:hypothetical protein
MINLNREGGKMPPSHNLFIKIAVLLAIAIFSSPLQASYKFKMIDSIPFAIRQADMFIGGYDTNHNGLSELIFPAWHPELKNYVLSLYEYRPINKHELVYADTLTATDWFYPEGVGDVDKDSLIELVVDDHKQFPVGHIAFKVQTRESPSYNDYPRVVNWEVSQPDSTMPFISLFMGDVNQNSKNEIWTETSISGGLLKIYENVANNKNVLVSSDTIALPSGFPWGDFDGDGKNEFAVWGTKYGGPYYGAVVVYKSSGDNQYKRVWMEIPPFTNGHDIFSGNDCDGDGKPEFFVGYMQPIGSNVFMTYLVQYEAIGVDLYKSVIIDSFQVSGLAIARQSCCGDVDGDGREEIIWSLGTWVVVLKATGDDRYERIWWLPNGLGGDRWSVRALCYDFNNDGYNEIILSGEEKTQIWEIEPTSIPETKTISGKPFVTRLNQNYPNPFSDHTIIKYQIGGTTNKASLQIYDVSGRLVKDFTKAQSLKPGAYSVVWNGRNDQNRLLPAGIYFVELLAGNLNERHRLTKKLVLQR